MTREAQDFLTDEQFLVEHAHMSLADRAHLVNCQFNTEIDRHVVGRLYKRLGISKKKILAQVRNPSRYTQQDMWGMTEELQRQVNSAILEGYEILVMDECHFDGRDFNRNAWSRPAKNVVIQQLPHHNERITVMGASSLRTGHSQFLVAKGTFKSEDF